MEKIDQDPTPFVEESKVKNMPEEAYSNSLVPNNTGYSAPTSFNQSYFNSEVRYGLPEETDRLNDRLLRAIEGVGGIDERAREALFQNQTLIQRLFPSQENKIVEEMKGKIFSSALEAHKKIYELCSVFQIEVLRERCNATLVAMKGAYRRELGQFLTQQIQELQRCISARQEEFVSEVERQYKQMYSLNYIPSLQAQYKKALDTLTTSYFDFLQTQIYNYERIMNEQITKFARL